MMVLKNKTLEERSNQMGFRNDIRNLTRRLAELYALQKISVGEGDEEMGSKVITLVGENRGAAMDLRFSTDGEENYRRNLHSKGAQLNAFVNSNVQSANNSILYDSTCTYRDPGAQLSLSNAPKDSVY
ncbi:hypothetical protein SUGI_0351920 [Cryptomeria japonica]|nr:hypothetical protein SUGI_0351920 [Cryptomeria japonica]